MKKLFLILTALILVTSCRKDDEPETIETNPLVGTWKITKYETRSGANNSLLDYETISGCEANDTFTFNTDNTINIKYYTENTSGDTGCVLYDEENGSYSYNQSTKILTLKSAVDNSSENYKIESITSNQMIMVSDEFDENGDGVLDKNLVYFNK